jgi:hypothetical protein
MIILEEQKRNREKVLNLYDFLVDEKSNKLSEYLSLSIEAKGEATKVSVTTVEDIPTTYSSVLNSLSITGLQDLMNRK